jgi:hypothetical protein
MFINARNLDLDALAEAIDRERPTILRVDARGSTPLAVFCLLARTAGRVRHVIVDADFSVAHLVDEFPHLRLTRQ